MPKNKPGARLRKEFIYQAYDLVNRLRLAVTLGQIVVLRGGSDHMYPATVIQILERRKGLRLKVRCPNGDKKDVVLAEIFWIRKTAGKPAARPASLSQILKNDPDLVKKEELTWLPSQVF